jgi:CHAT domain-containing protein
VEILSDALLRGWIERVPRGSTLLLQPAAEMEGIAFAMLKTADGERLLRRNPLASAPSLRAFAHAYRDDATRAGATSVFFAAAPRPGGAFDPIPLAAREVRRASRSYARPLVEAYATRAAFLAHSPSFSIVHFAGHALVNAARPSLSALVFDERDLLYVHQLERLTFAKARLVVLSGCDTGRSLRPTMSMANALLRRNVPSVVYTFWPVSDEAASAFAVQFHCALAAGSTRAEAVRTAQISLMRKWPEEPGAWAAFALAGAPGALQQSKKNPHG